MLVVMIQIAVNQAVSSAEERLRVAMVGIEQAPNLEEFLAARGIDPDPMHSLADLEGAAAAVALGSPPFVLVLDPGFAEEFGSENPARVTVVFDRSNQRDANRVERLQRALRAYGERIGALRVLARGVSPEVARPLVVDAWDVSTPAGRSALLLGILTYFLLFATLMGGMYLATDATAVLGPVQNSMQFGKLQSLYAEISQKGWRTIPPTDPSVLAGDAGKAGFFLPPTLVDNPPDDSRIVAEEQFGPIVPLLKWSDEEDVVRRANSSLMGLGGSVWSADVAKAEREARLDRGTLLDAKGEDVNHAGDKIVEIRKRVSSA